MKQHIEERRQRQTRQCGFGTQWSLEMAHSETKAAARPHHMVVGHRQASSTKEREARDRTRPGELGEVDGKGRSLLAVRNFQW